MYGTVHILQRAVERHGKVRPVLDVRLFDVTTELTLLFLHIYDAIWSRLTAEVQFDCVLEDTVERQHNLPQLEHAVDTDVHTHFDIDIIAFCLAS